MNIAVIGAGYVGLVTGACFAELGNHVTCVDVDVDKIMRLNQGILPIYEPGLETLVLSGVAEKRLHFVTSLQALVEQPQMIFIAVGTPPDEDGSADMRYVLEAATAIGQYLTKDCVVVDKSTVPVGVADRVLQCIQSTLQARNVALHVEVVSNPEFLREGAAIDDFMQPDRVIIGLNSEMARALMLELYRPIVRQPEKIYFMTVRDAEMTKYVANAMLATRISFMNEMAELCERMNVDVENVRIGIGSDSRIGPAFLYPGCGYGGSCFPKDVKALIHMAEQNQFEPVILHAVEKRNKFQKQLLAGKICRRFGENLSGLRIGIWGLSFKPGTDDMREASSIILIEKLLACGAEILAYDPVAMPVAQKLFPVAWLRSGKLTFAAHQYDALSGVDALVLVTEWKPFCYPDLVLMKKVMRQKIIFDGRNQYDPHQIREAGFEYDGVGRGRCP